MTDISALLTTMQALRDKDNGCAWDIKQTFETIAPYTIEEAYEVVDAITRKNMADLKEEMGDLLLQVVFHAQIASELGLFTFEDVAKTLNEKLIRRHPHVFGDKKNLTPEETKLLWAQIKREERKDKPQTLFSDITNGLPPLKKALEIQKKMAQFGFDWRNATEILEKLNEETQEFKEELENGTIEKQEQELGDLFFVLVNIARHLKIDSERALSLTNEKFMKRSIQMEQQLKNQNLTLETASLEQMEFEWFYAKRDEK